MNSTFGQNSELVQYYQNINCKSIYNKKNKYNSTIQSSRLHRLARQNPFFTLFLQQIKSQLPSHSSQSLFLFHFYSHCTMGISQKQVFSRTIQKFAVITCGSNTFYFYSRAFWFYCVFDGMKQRFARKGRCWVSQNLPIYVTIISFI